MNRVHNNSSKSTIKIGIFVDDNPASRHLLYFYRFLEKYKNIAVTVLIHEKYFTDFIDSIGDEHFCVSVYSNLESIDLDIAILNDFDHKIIPSGIIKIGVAHGIDIPMERLIDFYVAPVFFDYILNSSSDNALPENYSLLDRYPNEYLCHDERFLCVIPFGSCKLDAFYNQYNKTEKNSIIYHLSSLDYEFKSIRDSEIVRDTLELLLKTFPEFNVIFRPFPSDLDDDFIKILISDCSGFSNFILSTSSDYIEDYSKAFVLISHRPYRKHLFKSVGGSFLYYNPLKDFDKNFTDRSLDCFHRIKNSEELISKVWFAYSNFQSELDNLNSSNKNVEFFNFGFSVDYLVKNIKYIIGGVRNSAWDYYDLYCSNVFCFENLIQGYINEGRPFDLLSDFLLMRNRSSYNYYLSAVSRGIFLSESTIECRIRKSFSLLVKSINISDEWHEKEKFVKSWWVHKGRVFLETVKNQGLKFSIYEIWLINYFNDYEFFFGNEHFLSVFFGMKQIFTAKTQLILYGAGEICELVLDLKESSCGNFQIRLVSDSDSDKVGKSIRGFNISSVSDVIAHRSNIFICSEVYFSEIKEMLISEGVSSQRILTN